MPDVSAKLTGLKILALVAQTGLKFWLVNQVESPNLIGQEVLQKWKTIQLDSNLRCNMKQNHFHPCHFKIWKSLYGLSFLLALTACEVSFSAL